MYSYPEYEEGDIQIIYHICKTNHISNLMMISTDTDILVILVSNMDEIDHNNKVYKTSGTNKSDDQS